MPHQDSLHFDGGWCRLYRGVMDSPLWSHDGLFKLFAYCRMEANFAPSECFIPGSFETITIHRGQFVTGQNILYKKLYPKPNEETPTSRTLWKWLNVLQDLGFVKLESLKGRCTIVTVVNYDPVENVKTAGATEGQSVSGVDGTSADKPVETAKDKRTRFKSDTAPRKKRRQATKIKSVDDIAVPPELSSQEFIEAWSLWIKYRTELSKPLTRASAEMLLKKFVECGVDAAISRIMNSITNGWHGIYDTE